jgi:triphosphoribosyl-dephospho-CoA synthase
LITGKPDIDSVCKKAAEMTAGLCQRELATLKKHTGLSNGEKLYWKYGLKGIRGEVENGFATVRSGSLPLLRKLKSENHAELNDLFVFLIGDTNNL